MIHICSRSSLTLIWQVSGVVRLRDEPINARFFNCLCELVGTLSTHEDWAVRHLTLGCLKQFLRTSKMTQACMTAVAAPMTPGFQKFLRYLPEEDLSSDQVYDGLLIDQCAWNINMTRKRQRTEAPVDSIMRNVRKRVSVLQEEIQRLTDVMSSVSGVGRQSSREAVELQTSLKNAKVALTVGDNL